MGFHVGETGDWVVESVDKSRLRSGGCDLGGVGVCWCCGGEGVGEPPTRNEN